MAGMKASLFYISRSRLDGPRVSEQLTDILAASVARNSVLDLTGLLVATPLYFAQFLEGGRVALASVMASIRADSRHTDLWEVETTQLGAVQFPNWRMACFPPSSFTSRHLHPLLERKHGNITSGEAADLILSLHKMSPEFSRVPPF